MRDLRKKEVEAKLAIEIYFEKNGIPPSYEKLSELLKLSETATYARCRNIRHMMNHHKPTYRDLELELNETRNFKHEYNILHDEMQNIKQLVYKEVYDKWFTTKNDGDLGNWLFKRMKNIE